MKKLCLSFLSFAIALCLMNVSAMARPLYRTAFEKQYNVKKPTSDAEKSLAAAVKKANACNVCHIKKQKKKVRNNYGQALKKLLKKYDSKRAKSHKEEMLKEVAEALKKIEKEKSESGETYGQLIQAGKLPFPPKPVADNKVADKKVE